MSCHRGPPPQGVVLFRGPSLLDGSPIVCVATGLIHPSDNRATGPMIQCWILREDVDPVTAERTGQDASVCSDCALRGNGCYVLLHQAPLQVWRTDHAGHYPTFQKKHEHLFRGRQIRLGAYGDPAAVPARIWKRVVRLAWTHTGYTSQWRTCDPALRQWLMASVKTLQELHEARALDWKTYRVRLPEEPLLEDEFVCPKSDEFHAQHGHRLLCVQCNACHGGEWSGQATPATIVHGSIPKVVRFRRMRLALRVLR